MRYVTLLVALLAASQSAHARLFWQTYGATVATPGGGCAWNLNSDYFVPRTCDSGGYDLFSPCKTVHRRSPACKNLHPTYAGYCTPYGECHYRWQDHVYKKYCGCTPLRHTYGPWRLDKCRKHGCASGHASGPCPGETCDAGGRLGVHGLAPQYAATAWMLPNVEPMGGETLGTIVALPGTMAGRPSVGDAAIAAPGTLPALPAPGGAAFPIPGMFGM